jgi:molybdenum cofactor cytidylyltransferase
MAEAGFAAIIPAAGFSSRMGVFKPLLPVGTHLVIEKTVDCFKQAGIRDIRVVVGYKRKLLTPVLERLNIQIVINDKFTDGMYTSIQAGVRTLDDSVKAFFIIPADCPFVEPDTVTSLMSAYRAGHTGVIYPTHNNRRGHPTLISNRLRELIIKSNPEGGLKSLLEKHAGDFKEVPVDDPGICIDMDTVNDYQTVSGMPARFPSEEDCLKLLGDANAGKRVLLHSKEVARIAVAISEHMNSAGVPGPVNLGLVMAAGLLHDIARERPEHAKAGAEIVSGLGYGAVADIIALHMDIDSKAAAAPGEAAIVYLADKMVKENKARPIEERLSESLARFEGNKEAAENIRDRFNKAMLIKKRVEEIIKGKVEDIL